MFQMLNALQGSGGGQTWPALMAALQLIVGWQLIRMRPNYKLVATIWAIAATLVAAYINYPMMKAMAQLGALQMFGRSGAGGISFIVVAISLIAPIATLILVRRSQRDLPAVTVVAE